ncbi:putative signal peptide protein [Puccinia sorghi]|uniref:Putative signal peptide protein n=1 Tax=Puccinia sorghi TaxID=27349 RepID=A0A0L6UDX5_9BASI|nr:putative signal peptide protein [Puccinia sorghi]
MLALMMCFFAFSKNNTLPTKIPINQFISPIFLIYLLEAKKSKKGVCVLANI